MVTVAARVRAGDEAGGRRRREIRAVPATGIRDFFDLAETLLEPDAVQRALAELDRATLAVLAVATLYGLETMAVAAEIEPFKTAISLRMERAWPFVAFRSLLPPAGLFVERGVCRVPCPPGAARRYGGWA